MKHFWNKSEKLGSTFIALRDADLNAVYLVPHLWVSPNLWLATEDREAIRDEGIYQSTRAEGAVPLTM